MSNFVHCLIKPLDKLLRMQCHNGCVCFELFWSNHPHPKFRPNYFLQSNSHGLSSLTLIYKCHSQLSVPRDPNLHRRKPAGNKYLKKSNFMNGLVYYEIIINSKRDWINDFYFNKNYAYYKFESIFENLSLIFFLIFSWIWSILELSIWNKEVKQLN